MTAPLLEQFFCATLKIVFLESQSIINNLILTPSEFF